MKLPANWWRFWHPSSGMLGGAILGATLAVPICLIILALPTTDRSSLKLHTDAMTGCQYLSTSGGGITPRLDSQGKQICGSKEEE